MLFTTVLAHAVDITWTGPSGGDFFDPANWDNGLGLGPDPDGDPNNPATPYTGGNIIFSNSSAVASQNLLLGTGLTMTVTNSSLDFTGFSIQGVQDAATDSVFNSVNSTITVQSITNDAVFNLTGASTLRILASNNSINGDNTPTNNTQANLAFGSRIVNVNGNNSANPSQQSIGSRIFRSPSGTSFATDFATAPFTEFGLSGADTTPFSDGNQGPFTITAGLHYTAYWTDTYNTSVASSDINFEYNTVPTPPALPRQTGIPVPYVSNPRPPESESSDYHQQIAGPPEGGTTLLLAGDGAAGLPFPDPTVGLTLASPTQNFDGSTPGGDVIGKRITFSLDVAANGVTNVYTQASITLGSGSTLTYGGKLGSHVTIRFIEDTFSATPSNFIQVLDGNILVGNTIPNPAGAGAFDVQIDINDADGNPWDGIGATTLDLYINNTLVTTFTKESGGYTDNIMTLEGSANFNGYGLATHLFDKLTVYSAVAPFPNDRFKVTQIITAGPGQAFVGTFYAPLVGSYQIQSNLDLVSPWQLIDSVSAADVGTTPFTISDAQLNAAFGPGVRPRLFVRIVKQP